MIRNYISFLHFSSTVFGGHYITSRSLDLTGIRFTDVPAKLDLSPTSSEESISNLILPVTEDATLSQEPVEVTGHARDCCAFDSSTMCTLL